MGARQASGAVSTAGRCRVIEEESMRRNKLALYLHLVWATWDRLPLITPDIERRLHRNNELPRGKPRGIRRAAIADRKPFCSSWPDLDSLHSGESVLHRHTAQLYSYSNHLTRTRRPRVVVSQQALG